MQYRGVENSTRYHPISAGTPAL